MGAIILNGQITSYSIDQSGKIYSHISNRFLNPFPDKDGYLIVNLAVTPGNIVKMRVHKLVALTFIPNPENLPQINHIDNNRQNNSVDNLEWISLLGNIEHRVKQDRSARQKGSLNGVAKLSEHDILLIREAHLAGTTYAELARQFKVSASQIRRIVLRQRWRHL